MARPRPATPPDPDAGNLLRVGDGAREGGRRGPGRQTTGPRRAASRRPAAAGARGPAGSGRCVHGPARRGWTCRDPRLQGVGDPWEWLSDARRAVVAAGLSRSLDPHGRDLLDLASNDYLGLSRHPAVIAGAAAALERYGAGSTGSRL